MNIILVVFDSLRKDCISHYGSPPWGKVHTPYLDKFADESLVMTRGYPESLPTLPARRALYTGQRTYPFRTKNYQLRGDFTGSPGWGPIPEHQDTMAEILNRNGYRTGLISDVYHMFKPSKNFWRGFNQWTFVRGQEVDYYRSGPLPSDDDINYWLPEEFKNKLTVPIIKRGLMNMYGRSSDTDYFNAQVMSESVKWLEQNKDAEKIFLTVECFSPHEFWFVPEHYRQMYDDKKNIHEQVISTYSDISNINPELIFRTQANYSGLVTMCDRWFGYLYESVKNLGMLGNTVILVTADHGHSIGDDNYLGKRPYPSRQEVLEIPIIIRHPDITRNAIKSNLLVQHTDITATILKFAGIHLSEPVHGRSFWKAAIEGGGVFRDHVTVGWGASVTLINDQWWFNCPVNGKGAILHDLTTDKPFSKDVADSNEKVVKELFDICVSDAGGEFPDYLIEIANKGQQDPGCTPLLGDVDDFFDPFGIM